MFEYSNNEKTPRNGWVLRWNGSLRILARATDGSGSQPNGSAVNER